MTTFVSLMFFEISMCMSVYCGGQVDDLTREKTGSTVIAFVLLLLTLRLVFIMQTGSGRFLHDSKTTSLYTFCANVSIALLLRLEQ